MECARSGSFPWGSVRFPWNGKNGKNRPMCRPRYGAPHSCVVHEVPRAECACGEVLGHKESVFQLVSAADGGCLSGMNLLFRGDEVRLTGMFPNSGASDFGTHERTGCGRRLCPEPVLAAEAPREGKGAVWHGGGLQVGLIAAELPSSGFAFRFTTALVFPQEGEFSLRYKGFFLE